jgi:hypothetical protein
MQKFSAIGQGEMVVDIPNGADVSQLKLTEVLYSPEVGYTLVSVGHLDENRFTATFGNGKCVICGPDGEQVGEVVKNHRGLYRVQHEPDETNAAVEAISLDKFHCRMGHITPNVAKKLAESSFVTGVCLKTSSSGDPVFCESCVYAKATQKPVSKFCGGDQATEFGAEIHSDLWGPALVVTKGGRCYYVTFVDDCTRWTHIDLLCNKTKTFTSYKDFKAWCETTLGAHIKVFHSDRGGEYIGKEFIAHLKEYSTAQKLTTHHAPQHNGIAECCNCSIVKHICALLHSSSLPKNLWGEATCHIVWLMNRTTMKAVVGMTPFEAVFGQKPDLQDVCEWGEKVWVRVEKGNKLGGHVCEGHYVGIDDRTTNGFRIYWPDTRTVTVEHNVHFDKTQVSVERLKGEDWEFVEPSPDAPPNSTPGPSSSKTNPPSTTPIPTPTNPPAPPVKEECRPTCERRPSQHIQAIIDGHGSWCCVGLSF